jgi:nucleoside-diphosphate-sugar epimerase
MSRALITGIEGFTGRYMAQVLERSGFEVHGLARRASQHARVTAVDLCDASALAEAVARVQPEVVVHLAAIAFVAHGDVQAIYRINVAGARNLMAALAACPTRPKAVLLASSANVYGNSTAGVIDESVPPSPANDYAVSKLAMEFMAALWYRELPVTIARPFNYTGVGQSDAFLLPKIVDHFRRRAPVLELGNLDVERDFSDVRMVVDCYARLLRAEQPSKVFNVCSGQGYTLREVLSMVTELAGYAPEIRVNPAFVRANEVKKLVGSRQALEGAIGPVDPIPLRETLRWMLEEP